MIEVYVGDNASGKTFLLEKKFKELKKANSNNNSLCLIFPVNRNIKLNEKTTANLDIYLSDKINFNSNREISQSHDYYRAIYKWCIDNKCENIKDYFSEFFNEELVIGNEYLSDGHTSFLVIISELIFCKNKFPDLSDILVIIDEVESYLHLNQQQKFLRYLEQKFDVSLIVSTHSIKTISRIEVDIIINYVKNKNIVNREVLCPAKISGEVLDEKILNSPRFVGEIKNAIDLVSKIINNDYMDCSNIEKDLMLLEKNCKFSLEYKSYFDAAIKILKIKRDQNA